MAIPGTGDPTLRDSPFEGSSRTAGAAIVNHEHASLFADCHARAWRSEVLSCLDAIAVRADDRDPTTDIGNDIAIIRRLDSADWRLQAFDDWFEPAICRHGQNLIRAPVGD